MAVNRLVSFVVGGLLVYIAITASVVSNLKAKNTELTNALNSSQYEPGRLLADAKAQIASREYAKAKVTLMDLLEKRPGAPEAVEGKALYQTADAAIANANAKWDAAAAGVKAHWEQALTAQLRGASEKTRLEMENGLSDTLNKEWEKSKDQVRSDWSKQQG
ncbi:MAG TPA: hypothetical protein VMV68_02930 [Spirochaetia bacterium]|nr:hypothetical protein [Spirochaetia bacterium]